LQKSDLSKADLAALGHEKPQICWEEETSPSNAEDEKAKEITDLETTNDKKVAVDEEKGGLDPTVDVNVNDNPKNEEESQSKPAESEAKTSGTSALLFAAFYEDWASKTGKVCQYYLIF